MNSRKRRLSSRQAERVVDHYAGEIGIQRVVGIDKVEFRSFKYLNEPRGPNEIWAGMAGEFVGENRNFEEITEVSGGEIYKRIKKVKQDNKFIGNELWLVKTIFK